MNSKQDYPSICQATWWKLLKSFGKDQPLENYLSLKYFKVQHRISIRSQLESKRSQLVKKTKPNFSNPTDFIDCAVTF